MSFRRILLASLFVSIIYFVANVWSASPPSIISYQGKVLVSGLPVTTTLPMSFEIYSSLNGGSLLYTASGTLPATTTVNITPENGLFSVNLGDEGTNAISSDIFKSNSDLFLQVIINGESLSPRKRITASPYALNTKYLDGNFATSTPTTTKYIPISDTFGNFDLNNVTSSKLFVSGNVTANNVSSSAFTLNNITINDWFTAGPGLNLNGTVFSLNTSSANIWSGLQTFNNVNITSGTVASSAISGLSVSNFATNTISQWVNDEGYITSSALSGYLTGETDPVWMSASSSFVRWDAPSTTYWNTAFSWGNHALVGYLTSFSELDPIWSAVSTSLSTSNFATNGISQWVNDSGYISSTNSGNINDVLLMTAGGAQWVPTSSLGITGGSGTTYTAGSGLNLIGNEFSLDVATSNNWTATQTFSSIILGGVERTTWPSGSGSMPVGVSGQFLVHDGSDWIATNSFTTNTYVTNILPLSHLSYTVGNSSSRFSEGWFENVYVGSSTWKIGQNNNGLLTFSDISTGSSSLSINSQGFVGFGIDQSLARIAIKDDSYVSYSTSSQMSWVTTTDPSLPLSYSWVYGNGNGLPGTIGRNARVYSFKNTANGPVFSENYITLASNITTTPLTITINPPTNLYITDWTCGGGPPPTTWDARVYSYKDIGAERIFSEVLNSSGGPTYSACDPGVEGVPNFSWTASSDQIDGYLIDLYAFDFGGWVGYKYVSSSQTTFTGTTEDYDDLIQYPPADPPTITPTSTLANDVLVRWNWDAVSGADGYLVNIFGDTSIMPGLDSWGFYATTTNIYFSEIEDGGSFQMDGPPNVSQISTFAETGVNETQQDYGTDSFRLVYDNDNFSALKVYDTGALSVRANGNIQGMYINEYGTLSLGSTFNNNAKLAINNPLSGFTVINDDGMERNINNIKVINDIAYTLGRQEDIGKDVIRIYDVSDKSNPIQLSTTTPDTDAEFNNYEALDVSGNYLYIYEWDNLVGSGAIGIYNVSNPSSVVKTTSINLGDKGVMFIKKYNDYLYYLIDDGTKNIVLRVYDVSDPSSPVFDEDITLIYGDVTTYGTPVRFDIFGNHAYIIENSGLALEIINLDTLANFTMTAGMPSRSFRDIKVVGNYIYVAQNELGLRVFDITTSPLSPVEMDSSVSNHGEISRLKVEGDLVYAIVNDMAGMGDDGIEVFDISNPSSINSIGYYVTRFIPTNLDADADNYVFVDAPAKPTLILQFNYAVGASSYAAIINGGNVGIGTSTPGSLLTVDGSSLFTGNAVFNNQIQTNYGITMADNVPTETTNALYNSGSVLYWNGSAVGGSSLPSGSFTGDTLYWDGSAWASNSIFQVTPSNYSILMNGNVNYGNYNFVLGSGNSIGYSNYSSISGGQSNSIGDNSSNSVISGGSGNSIGAWNYNSAIVGGNANTANGSYSFIGGGYSNNASTYATVGGGYYNTASNLYSTIGGGYQNTASGQHSFIGGGYNNTSTQTFSSVVGGRGNIASGEYSFVGGGGYNSASELRSVIVGGNYNSATGENSFIGNGYINTAAGLDSFVGNGEYNTASGMDSFVGSGYNNTASGHYSFIGSGYNNTASGQYAFIGSGYGNTAAGNYSSAFGESMQVHGANSFGIALNGSGYYFTQSNAMSIMGGNVGVGTTTPNSPLTVYGTTTINNGGLAFNNYAGVNGQILMVSSTGQPYWTSTSSLGINLAAGLSGEIQFNDGSGSFDANSNFVWDNTNGKLGIGTSTPSESLTVMGNILQIPKTSILKGSYDTPGRAYGVYVSGNYAYVADGTDGLRIIDVSNPNSPLSVGTYATPGPGWARDVYVSGKYAYVADGNLQIINVSDPSSPVLTGSYDIPESANSVHVSGNYAYMFSGGAGLLYIIDISNPNTPVLVGFYNVGPLYSLGDIYVYGNYAYFGASSSMYIVDVSNPGSPVLIGTYDTLSSGIHNVYVSGKYTYLGVGHSMQIIDVSSPDSPSLVGTYDLPGSAYSVYVSGNYAYVTNYSAFSPELVVIDVSNPSSPVLVENINAGGYANSVYVSGKYAYLTLQAEGLQIIDISGTEVSSLLAHSAEVGNLSIINDLSVKGNTDLSVLTVGQGGILSQGPMALSAGLFLASTTPATTTYALYNQGGSLYWNGTTLGLSSSYISQWVNDVGYITSTGDILPTGSLGQTLFNDGSTWSPTSTLFISGSGVSVGILNTSTGRLLSVHGDAVINNQLISNQENGIYFGRTRISENIWEIDTSTIWSTSTARMSDQNRVWRGNAMSSDGKYQSAVVNGGYIYTSNDYGNNWVTSTNAGLRDWWSIAMSSDGKYQSAVVYNGQIYISSDYGNTWSAEESEREWFFVAMSSDGKYQSAVGYATGIYVSSDYGNSWSAKSVAGFLRSITISSDGKYQSVAIQNGQIYISSDYGNSWTEKNESRAWRSIAMSSDGKYQSAVNYDGYIYTSNDYGNNWVTSTNSNQRNWWSITMSPDGKYQTALVYYGKVYVSSDYGINWTEKDSVRYWYSIAMSSNGKYQTAVAGGTDSNNYIYTTVARSKTQGDINITGNYFVNGSPLNLSGSLPSGTNGQMLFYNNSAWTATSTIFISSSTGYVGIGTTTPTSLLTVGSNAGFKVNSSGNLIKINGVTYNWPSSQGGASSTLMNDSNGNLIWGYASTTVVGAGGSNGQIQFNSSNVLAGSSNFVWDNVNGRLGIGTASPLGTLHIGSESISGPDSPTGAAGTIVYDDTPVAGNWVNDGNSHSIRVYAYKEIGSQKYYSTSFSLANVADDSGNMEEPQNYRTYVINWSWNAVSEADGYLILKDDSMVNYSFENGATTSVESLVEETGSEYNDAYFFEGVVTPTGTEGGTKFIVNASGNVGINTSTPDEKLTLSGNLNIINNGLLKFDGASGTAGQILMVSSSGFQEWVNTSTLGISGGSLPSGVDGQMLYNNGSSWMATSSIFISSSTGYVGIGDSNPTNKLSVNGSLNITNNGLLKFNGASGTIGQILMVSTTTGRPEWANTSTLGISGGSLPSGINGQTLFYNNSTWEATNTLFVTGNGISIGTSTTSTGRLLSVHGDAVINNQLISNQEGGLYFGRTKIIENSWAMDESNIWATSTAKESNRSWYSIAMSSDGKYQSAVSIGQIYVSSDYGTTWSAKDSSRNWYSIAMSSDGKYQSAVSVGQIYTSSDYGNTWAPKDSSRNWRSISISSDGKYQSAVVDNGKIYTSSDYGNTWAPKDSSRNWRSISISSDGKYQTAVVNSSTANGYIYTSSDYGNTWVVKMDDSNRLWVSVSLSSDSKYQSAVVYGGQIYISSDYGNTWAPKDSNRNWYSIALSSNGKYQSAVVIGGQIYVSSDYGTTWSAKDSSKNWYSIAMSSDGRCQSAVVTGGQIYTTCAGLYNLSNIGIGTTTLNEKLTVAGNLNITSNGKLQFNGSAGSVGQLLMVSSTSNQEWVSTSSLISILPNGTAGQTMVNVGGYNWQATSSLFFASNGDVNLGTTSAGLIIKANGNVGVGTTTPNYKFTVAGNISVTGSYYIGNIDYGINFPFMINSAGTSGYVWRSDGNGVGGWINPASLFVDTTTSPAGSFKEIQFNNNGIFGATSSFVWDNVNGRLGIGTSTPQESFSVVGSIVQTQVNPILESTYLSPSGTVQVYISGKYAYLATLGSGLKILDIFNPKVPTLVGEYNTTEAIEIVDVYVSGKYAYLADRNEGLKILDISDPSNPVLSGEFAIESSYISRIFGFGKYLYISQGSVGLRIIDISNPVNPISVGVYNTPDSAADVYVSGKYAYVADGDSLEIVDISDPTNPTFVSSFDEIATLWPINDAWGIYVSDKYVYLTVSDDGLLVIDVSDPYNPTLSNRYNTPSYAIDVYVSGKYAYVADEFSGIQILDISIPNNVKFVGSYDTPSSALGIYVSGDHAYVADSNSGLKILKISGTEVSSIVAGSAEIGNLQIRNNLITKGFGDFGALTVGSGGILSNGSISISNTTTPNYFGGYVGIGTSTPSAKLHINNGGLLVTGSVGDTPISGAGTKLMWVPSKSAFRAGKVTGDQWDSANIGSYSSVFGYDNIGSESYSFVGGGFSNTVGGNGSIIMGGRSNVVSGTFSFIGGGYENLASGSEAFIGGGFENIASGHQSFIGGGIKNVASGTYSFIGGGENIITFGSHSAVIGGQNNATIGGQSFIGGGVSSTVSGGLSFIGGGLENNISGENSFVGGGRGNILSGNNSAIIGGEGNQVKDLYSVIGGGLNNSISSTYSFIGGGEGNVVTGTRSFIAGGKENKIGGDYSFIGAGYQSEVYGNNASAFGRGMIVNKNSSFGISLDAGPYNIDTVSVMAIMGGSVGIGTVSPSTTLFVEGTAGGSSAWIDYSDENLKTNIATIENALSKVISLRGVNFDWKDPEKDFPGRKVGLIAQEVKNIMPEVVNKIGDYYGIQYAPLTALLVEAIKEQQLQIDALKNPTTTLTVENDDNQIMYTVDFGMDITGRPLLNVASIIGSDNKWEIDINGTVISKVTTTSGIEKKLYGMSSENIEITLSGTSTLENGEARIIFPSETQELIDETQPIKVVFSLTSPCSKNIYVSEKSKEGFVLKEVEGIDSGVTFDWVVVVKRKFADLFIEEINTEEPISSGNEEPEEEIKLEVPSTEEIILEETPESGEEILPIEETPLVIESKEETFPVEEEITSPDPGPIVETPTEETPLVVE